ncbi:MAG: polyhydroxyalkanoate synthesis repressor PhaR [Pseudomonadota bacterium]
MARKSAETTDPVVIKKYANRRLYNTAKSSYVTLENLAEMVREDEDFVVRDAKTGEDITRSVLTQIIFEEEAKGSSMLPASFLRQLIRMYGDTMQSFVPPYLDASMDAFSRNQERLRDQMSSAFGTNPAMANFEAMTRRNMEMFENAMKMFTPFGTVPERGEEPTSKPTEAASPGGRDVELDDLKEQLRDMQTKLSKLAPDE